MKVFKMLAVLSISLLTLTACEEKVRSVSYYNENPDEMRKMKEKCELEREKGYELEGTLAQNCKNATSVSISSIASRIRQ